MNIWVILKGNLIKILVKNGIFSKKNIVEKI